MENSTVFILIGAGIAITVISIIIYYILRWMRGSIKLIMPITAFNRGDVIKGNLELQTRKAIQGNKLVVSLIGEKVTRYYENDERKTRRNEVYRSEVVIEPAREYPAGHKAKHKFEITIPGGGNEAPSIDPAFTQILSMASQFLNNSDTYYEWEIEARLDAKGIDLAKSQKISIN